MPEPTVKPFIATSFAQLNKMANEPNENLRNVESAERLIETMNKLYTEAETELKKGNQDKAYVLFTRCMNCYIHLSSNIKNFDPKYFKLMYGKQIQKAYKYCEQLSEVLIKCYEQRQQQEEQNKCDDLKYSIVEQKQIDMLSSNTAKKQRENSFQINGLEELSVGKEMCISCKELFDSQSENSTSISTLIIDIRPKEDFRLSSIKFGDVINIPENIITRGEIASKLESCLEESFKKYFRKRGEYNLIVIHDWFSSKAVSGTKLHQILIMLTKYDVKTKYKTDPRVLEGGFEEWLARYPIWTTNPKVKPPEKAQNDSKSILEKIDYPINEIFELDQEKNERCNVSASMLIPVIDRSTKPLVPVEKVTEDAENEEECTRNNIDGNDIAYVTEDNISTAVKTEKLEPKINEINVDKKEEVLKSEEEMKNQYYQNGRRSALANIENPSPFCKEINSYADNEDRKCRSRDKENDQDEFGNRATAPNSSQNNENNAKMKRCSSTPNIAKSVSVENDKPFVDRSTKPSNDDQLNYFTLGCKYNSLGKGLTGLKNIGNTCYMNSIIQCLSNTEPLQKKLCEQKFRPLNEKSKTKGAVAREFASIIKQLWSGESEPVSCRSLKNIIGQHNDMFKGHDQQDSHEFLTILIDWLHEDLNEPILQGTLNGAEEISGEKAWGEFTRKNNSILRYLFYGQLRSTVSCRTCEKQSITFEPFSNLSLPLPSEEIGKCTLADCLRLYISKDDVDKWKCPGCHDLKRATKKLDITRLPPILVIHFKRFTSIGGCKKQRTFVDFPDKLDMRPFIIGQEPRFTQYELYAVSNHYGSMESGHYTAYCKNLIFQSWYEYDDQNIYPISKPVKSKEAYIVFYQCLIDRK